MTLKELSRLEEICEKAIPGPWVFDKENSGLSFDLGWGLYSEPDPDSISVRPTVAHISYETGAYTANFIAISRTALPKALAEIRMLRTALECIATYPPDRDYAYPWQNTRDQGLDCMRRIAKEALEDGR